MLHLLFGTGAKRSSTETDLRSHLLLHGNQGHVSLDADRALSNLDRDASKNPSGHEVRLIIAQELPDRAKVVLLDTQRTSNEVKPCSPRRVPTSPSLRRTPSASAMKTVSSSPDLVTELMFGIAPLSYKDSSVRMHPLPIADGSDRRSFLFTKIFTVDVSSTVATGSPSSTNSGMTSLSSSYGSISALREYPFPAMTPIKDDPESSDSSCRARHMAEPDRESSHTRGSRTLGQNHHRTRSGTVVLGRSNDLVVGRPDSGEVAPYVPFTKNDATGQSEMSLSGWLPSPGPNLRRRRRSTDTERGSTPSSLSHYTRYEGPVCAIGIIFTVPGDGHEDTECSLMARHWQMLTRATYALQRAVLAEIELSVDVLVSSGTTQPRHSRDQALPREKPQVYRRGKKCLIDLGHGCLLSNSKVLAAVEDFQTRLHGALHLPDIARKPLRYEADMLVDELSYLMDILEHKDAKFVFSILLTYLSKNASKLKQEGRHTPELHRNNKLDERLVIVSDNAVLARRLIFCIARLFFRDHNDHMESNIDYSLIWPAEGLLGVSGTELMRRKQANIAKALVASSGWDIPKHARPPSTGSHNVSPSVYHRPPSTVSIGSSRGSSWRPSWWFTNGSRSQLNVDDSSNRSESKTLQTSWNSADFKDIARSLKPGSASSWSPNVRDSSQSPRPDSEVATEEDYETEVPDAAIALRQLDISIDEHGAIDVAPLQTSSCITDPEQISSISTSVGHSGFPLTGVLSRFHPDMLLQSIPRLAYNDSQLKDYLVEEDSYLNESTVPHKDWLSTASIAIVELGSSCCLRKLTRLTRPISIADPIEPVDWSSDAVSSRAFEEKWVDEVLTELDEALLSRIVATIRTYKTTRDIDCVQRLINSLSACGSIVTAGAS